MLHTGLGQAEGNVTINVVGEVVAKCRKQIGDCRPQAGIVFAGPHFDHILMLQVIGDFFPGMKIIGCTTSGDFSSAFRFSEDSITMLVLDSDDIEIGVGVGRGISLDHRKAAREAVASAGKTLSSIPKFGLTFPHGYSMSPELVMQSLAAELGNDCPLFGGFAATLRLETREIYQFYNGEVLSDSLPLLLMAGPVHFDFAIANSWQPVGTESVVTEVKGRNPLKIGDQTAVDFYRHYLGYHEEPAGEFNLAVYEPGSDEYFLCSPQEYNEDDSITFSGNIREGSRVQLTDATRRDLLEDTVATCKKLSEKARSWQPAFALNFSCTFRKEILGIAANQELKTLQQSFPDGLPIMGFYSFGEISPLTKGGPSRVQGATLIMLLVGPGESKPRKSMKETSSTSDTEPNRLYDDTFLARKLKRSEQSRQRLESLKDFSSNMHRQIIDELIEARKKILEKEVELRKSEEKFRRIVQTAGEGFILMDENHKIVDVNEAFCRMIGYSSREVLGKSIIDFAPDEFHQFVMTDRPKLMDDESRKLEGSLLMRDERKVSVLIHSNVLRDDRGSPLGHMAFIADLTEQKKAIALAGEVQRSLLPQENPKVQGLDIAGRNISCEDVGGDYYDFFIQQDRTLKNAFSVAVGDITGHGVDAALLLSSARAYLRMHVSMEESLPQIVSAMNCHLSEDVMETGRFMTLFYLTIHSDLTSLEWIRAGHDPAILYDPVSRCFETLKGQGVALGIDPSYNYQSYVKSGLGNGHVIAIGTDGIWESRNSAGEMYGKERFEILLQRNAHFSASTILAAVFDELEQFRQGMKADDDITLVVIKINTKNNSELS